MKRLIASILLLAAFLCSAKAQNDAMFVYRNDGASNAFLKSAVDSMVCSQIDLDSLMHSDYVVQEIWTADSVYRIPLAVIDSIGFTRYFTRGLCPDHNHPHAIDLGLPSGTKWACCNVGAFTPEGYGGYYAWGETSEKGDYDWDTYAYYNSNTGEIVNLGSDIAGTPYDVAHVLWGGSWVMPSYDTQMELLKNCTKQWTIVNGVGGLLVTGPNDGQIFLPVARYRKEGGFGGEATSGYYWLSTTYISDYFEADYLNIIPNGWGCSHTGMRIYGQSVRAVCP